MDPQPDFTSRFRTYFEREVAQTAARGIANGAEIELRIQDSGGEAIEVFHFIRKAGKNAVEAGPAPAPEVLFTLTPEAAEAVLADPAADIATIGINIMKLIVSPDANRRISVRPKTGFLTLFSKGYFTVLGAGGKIFASFLASKGIDGLATIRGLFRKLKD